MEGSFIKKGISASVLKNVALITMTIDHFGAHVLVEILKLNHVPNVYNDPRYILTRAIGRIAFILYAFMIAEGAYKTRDRMRYASRLLICGIISIVPYSLCNSEKWFMTSSMNIFFLLFLGVVTIYAYDWLKEKISGKFLLVLARLAVVALSCYISGLLLLISKLSPRLLKSS